MKVKYRDCTDVFFKLNKNITIMSIGHCKLGRRPRGGIGRTSPPPSEFGAGGLSPQILSCCKSLSTRLLALEFRKMFFCLYSKTFIKSRHASPRLPVRSTPMTVTVTSTSVMPSVSVRYNCCSTSWTKINYLLFHPVTQIKTKQCIVDYQSDVLRPENTLAIH